uniref:Female-specific orf protein n=1 Tax=Megalonaias nervosa TaxID=52375 RepID=F4ZFI0_9BIVA|nr:female-specific orf protein [Megalonaias nervosa]
MLSCTLTFRVKSAPSALGYQSLTVHKTLLCVINTLRNKMTRQLIVFTLTGFIMLALFPSLITMTPEMTPQAKPSLMDNVLDNNQLPDTTPTNNTGTHPLNTSPASTNISDKK